MRSMLKYAAFCAAVLLIGAVGAGAGSLINGNRIKKGSIPENRLAQPIRSKLNLRSSNKVGAQGGERGERGGDGAVGPPGRPGLDGHDGRDALITVHSIGAPANDTGLTAWTKRQGTNFECDGSGDNSIVPFIGVATNPSSAGGLGKDSLKIGPFTGDNFANTKNHALDGIKLKDITEFKFDSFTDPGANPDPGGAATYVRLFLAGGHDVVFSQNTGSQAGKAKAKTWQSWDVTNGSVRYDDDAGNGPDITWAALIAAHGDEKVAPLTTGGGLVISGGCSIANGATDYVDNLRVSAGGQQAVFDFER